MVATLPGSEEVCMSFMSAGLVLDGKAKVTCLARNRRQGRNPVEEILFTQGRLRERDSGKVMTCPVTRQMNVLRFCLLIRSVSFNMWFKN